MTDYQTKHEPVDDYPYICYAPDVDANTDEIGGGSGGGGGGGGGGGNAIKLDVETGEGFFAIVDKTAQELYDLASNGSTVYIFVDMGDAYTGYAYLLEAVIFNGGTYTFNFGAGTFSFTANNADDNPSYTFN